MFGLFKHKEKAANDAATSPEKDMKKMKVVLALLLVAALCLALFAACAKPEKKIVGTWNGEQSVLGVVAKYSFTFNEDGTGNMTSALDIGVAMTYTIDGDKLNITTSILGITNTKTYTYAFEGDQLLLTEGDTTITLTKQA